MEQSSASFCPRCGTLLNLSDVGDVNCDKCGFGCKIEDLPTLSVVTHSFAKPVPEWFAEFQAAKKGAGAGSVNQKPQRAVVNEECPKCKNPSMEYYTMQLRSADEGQTVFYECTKCSHKFSVNT